MLHQLTDGKRTLSISLKVIAPLVVSTQLSGSRGDLTQFKPLNNKVFYAEVHHGSADILPSRI